MSQLFVYKPRMEEAVSRQRNDRQERAMKRMLLAEEHIQSKMTAAEALMMLKAANTHFNMSTQASTTVDCDASTQTTEIITITASTQTPAVTCADASVQTEPKPLCPAQSSVVRSEGYSTWFVCVCVCVSLFCHLTD